MGRDRSGLTVLLTLSAHRLDRRTVQALIATCLNRCTIPALLAVSFHARALLPPHFGGGMLTRAIYHREHVLGPVQRHELGLGERDPVALALGNPRQIMNRRFPGLSAVAD